MCSRYLTSPERSVLIDANILLYGADSTSPNFAAASAWLTETLNGRRRVGIPWQSIGAFVRIATHPRVMASPLTSQEAWEHVRGWLEAEPVWIPPATQRTAGVLGELLRSDNITGNLVPDAMIAALAIEHGLVVISADTDFERFPGVRRMNPLTR